MATHFKIAHLGAQLTYLDLAVDDFGAASDELREALIFRREFGARYEHLEDAVAALTESGEVARLQTIGVRFHYRLDSV